MNGKLSQRARTIFHANFNHKKCTRCVGHSGQCGTEPKNEPAFEIQGEIVKS